MAIWLIIGSLSGLLAVLLGAVGDHILQLNTVSREYINFQTALYFQMWHTLIILIIGSLQQVMDKPVRLIIHIAMACFTLGIILFSGGIYMHIMTQQSLFAQAVPIGGVSFIVGWFLLIISGVIRIFYSRKAK